VASLKGCASIQLRTIDLPNAAMQLAVIAPRFRADVKGKITPLVQTLYGFEKEATVSHYQNMDRARDLKKDKAFVNNEKRVPYHHPIIQQAVNVVWFNDGRRSEGVMFAHELFPLPYEAIALILAVVRNLHMNHPKHLKSKAYFREDRVLSRRVERRHLD
jgi:hypothetical protein